MLPSKRKEVPLCRADQISVGATHIPAPLKMIEQHILTQTSLASNGHSALSLN